MSQTKDTSNNVLTEVAYEYDAHGRQSNVIDKRNGATTYSYDNADLISEVRLPSQPVQVTYIHNDENLRNDYSKLPNGLMVTNIFNTAGLLEKTYGGPNYPVEYTYDAQGRMRTMKTWQDFDGNTGTSTTRWNYDQYRGWLESKEYPNETTGLPEINSGPSYTYTDAGRLKTRTWARGVTTTYNYRNSGDIATISYSDSTPTVSFTSTRTGQVATAVKDGVTTTLNYNDSGFVTSEFHTNGILDGHGMNYTYDNLLRLTNARTKIGNDNVDAINTYDASTGRLQKITHSDWLSGGTGYSYDVSYGYEENSNLIDQIDYGSSGKFETSRVYDGINRLIDVTHTPSNSSMPVSALYRYNTMNQRVEKEEADESYWKYQYDSLGQVISGKKYWADDTLVDGQDFEYAFDDIGNRTSTGGRDSSISTYDANYLNQYDDRTVAGKIDVMGVANPTASVTVNSNTSTRKGDYFHYPLSVSNGSGPVNQSVTVTSNYGSTQSATSNFYVPQSTENYTYDADGNLLSDGRWDYTWDAENRLIEMDTISAAPSSADIRMVFEYDYKGRRIRKLVYDTNDSLILERKYVYDQWNLQAELDGSNVVIRKYMWGPDLSGTSQGAGGVGGLLLICDIPSYGNKDYYFAGSDGNGNISVLIDADAGTIEGRYEYGPFGEGLRVSGSAIAGKNPFRFSSKYCDSESDYYYYGFRYYNPETGRWLNRDPIEEKGGFNLYGFAHNDSVYHVDYLGLTSIGQILDEFFSWFNYEEDLWVMDEKDPYTDIVRSWSHVHKHVMQIKREVARNPNIWKKWHTTSPNWKPWKSAHYDPRRGYEELERSPSGTDSDTATGAYIVYRTHGYEGQTLHTSAIGSFTIIATVDKVKGCYAEINIWMYNEMSKKSFKKYAKHPYFRYRPMASQHMWWNWKERFTFNSHGDVLAPVFVFDGNGGEW